MYAACDAVALTSANEGTPVSVIEALAARRPVVATDVGGVADVVQDGRSGFLVEARDVEGMADRLAELAADPGLRDSFGACGREDVLERYSVPRLVSEIDRLYRELLERASSPPRAVRAPISETLQRALPPSTSRRSSGRRLRVILVSQYFPPEIGATQSRMQSFAEQLADQGHQVTVICEFPNHPHGRVPAAYDGRVVEDDRSNAYRVLRVWVKADPDKTQRTRLAFYLSFMGLATAVAPRAGRADIVLATTPPLFTGLAGLAIARMNRAPFVLDVRDPVARGGDELDADLDRMADERRRAAGATALPVGCSRRDCNPPVLRAYRRDPGGWCPRGPDPERDARAVLRRREQASGDRLGVPRDRFLVTFAGTLGIAQALTSVLEAAARVDGAAEFAFVGDGPAKESVVEDAQRLGVTNVRFHAQMPLERIPPILAASDALLVPLSAHPTFQQFVPSKLIDSMAAGRPVLLAAAGEAARILELSGAGIVIAPEDPEALAQAVAWLIANPETAAEMGRRGREFAARRLRSVQAGRLEQLLLAVAGARHTGS